MKSLVSKIEQRRIWEENEQFHRKNRRENALNSVAETIAREWYRQCVRLGGFAKLPLWYREAHSDEKMSLPIVGGECPNSEYKLADFVISPAWTVQIAQHEIRKAMDSLPILGPIPF